MIALDASVVVAAFAPWHDLHVAAVAQIDKDPRLPAHAALEAYSVLTRLPPDVRADRGVVLDYLDAQFQDPYLVLTAKDVRALLAELGPLQISGGATYDALIAATARASGAALVSCDRRAVSTYERLGVSFELIG